MDWTTLGQILMVIFGSIFIWFCTSGIIHVILHVTNLWGKICLTIKRPKPKRYLTKVDPIYELKECSFSTDLYIHKWELEYTILFGTQLLLIFFPYPIELMYWRYQHKGLIFLCKKEEVAYVTKDLAKLYEDKMAPSIKEREEEKKKREMENKKIDALNQIFKQNYE